MMFELSYLMLTSLHGESVSVVTITIPPKGKLGWVVSNVFQVTISNNS